MESDAFRQNFLRFVAGERGLDWTPGEESFAAAREARLEKLGGLISDNVDREALLRLIEDGPPSGMSVVSGQQTAIGDASRAKAPPSVTGEVSPPIPTTFAVPGNGEQRSES